ncbi:hypothetical protein SANTM175S_07068 [Streptomyces antimycoticus]
MPPVIATSTRLACANACATSRELVTTVSPGTRASLAGQLLRGGSGADDHGLALVDETGCEIGDGRLLRGR